eukprot:m.127829 g.127829  ORF g.127829 m.127829 type:complete len:378 (+) comp22262_c0_seq1:51-1184(+)
MIVDLPDHPLDVGLKLVQGCDNARHCFSCLRSIPIGGEQLLCSGCYTVVYCSRECQKHHWKHLGHKAACADAKKERKSIESIEKKFSGFGGTGLKEPKNPCMVCKDNEDDCVGPFDDTATICTACGSSFCFTCSAAFNDCPQCRQQLDVSPFEHASRLDKILARTSAVEAGARHVGAARLARARIFALNGDHKSAFVLLADHDAMNAPVQTYSMLATLYELGTGVAQDTAKAKDLFKTGLKFGDLGSVRGVRVIPRSHVLCNSCIPIASVGLSVGVNAKFPPCWHCTGEGRLCASRCSSSRARRRMLCEGTDFSAGQQPRIFHLRSSTSPTSITLVSSTDLWSASVGSIGIGPRLGTSCIASSTKSGVGTVTTVSGT